MAAATSICSIKDDFPLLRRAEVHYLDSAATSQSPDAVIDAVRAFETEYRANVHGDIHRLSRAAIAAYREARDRVTRFLNAPSAEEVVFTYGATSAINLAAFSFGELRAPDDEIVLSELEHHSNLVPWQMLARRRGLKLRYLPMTEDGRLDLDELSAVVTERCRLIAITHCSNVTGAITDLTSIVHAARAVGAQVLIDGAQQVPHGPVDVQALGADFYALSGHKMFGPMGIGVLWGRRELLDAMPPFLTGGQMARRVTKDGTTFTDVPYKFEAGTPPVAGAIGLGAAIAWMERQDWSRARAEEMRLTRRMLEVLSGFPRCRVLGPTDMENRRGVVSFVVEGLDAERICSTLDEANVAVRCGDHCAQVLLDKFGVDKAARASLAIYNDDTDVDAFAEALGRALKTAA